MSYSDEENKNEEELYLPAKSVTDMLPDQSLSAEVETKLRKKGYKKRVKTASEAIKPLKILGFLLIFASLSYLIITQLRYIFFSTSYFELKEFEVSGNKTLDRDYIIKKSGIAPAQNIFFLETDNVKQRLLEEPFIKNADIELSGLNTLKITITEREPFIYAKNGVAFYEISEDGVILSTEGMGDKDLPIITGLKLDDTIVGSTINKNDDFVTAKNWLEILEKKELKHISEINFSNYQNPYIIMLTGEKILPLSAEDFKTRYVFLRALLDNLRKNNVETFYLDMRALMFHIVIF